MPSTGLGSDIMQRCDFITLIGVAAAWPPGAGAQQPARVARIGYLDRTSASLNPLRPGKRQT
jgi:hypothetical protein